MSDDIHSLPLPLNLKPGYAHLSCLVRLDKSAFLINIMITNWHAMSSFFFSLKYKQRLLLLLIPLYKVGIQEQET